MSLRITEVCFSPSLFFSNPLLATRNKKSLSWLFRSLLSAHDSIADFFMIHERILLCLFFSVMSVSLISVAAEVFLCVF
jgi:hypothetical protein